MQFTITLKNEKERSYRLLILFLVIIHVLFFLYLLFDKEQWKTGAAGLGLTFLYCSYRLLITNVAKKKFSFGSGYFFLIVLLFINFLWWVAVIDFILELLSIAALTPITLVFTSKDVQSAGYPFRKYKWEQFSNVILKDNMLTLDFKNNKLQQAEIEPASIKEEAFNNFAQEQLNKT
jgi:hypothetical protein